MPVSSVMDDDPSESGGFRNTSRDSESIKAMEGTSSADLGVSGPSARLETRTRGPSVSAAQGMGNLDAPLNGNDTDAECESPYEVPALTEDELIELEISRDQEIDAFVEQGLIGQLERWDTKYRDGFDFVYPEMALRIYTGSSYPLKPLTCEITNITLPRVVVDQLRAILRQMQAANDPGDTLKRWDSRTSSESGCFESDMMALKLAARTVAHLKHYRSDPKYWKDQICLRETDYIHSSDRREILKSYWNFGHIVPDHDDTYDPLNPDWSKKLTDRTEQQKLSFSNVNDQSEILDSMFGIDPSSIQGHDLANSILGKTPEEVCAKIPETFRILHVESVVRSDLVANFKRQQDKIRKDLEKLRVNVLQGSVKRETRLKMGKRASEKETLIEHLVTPELAFHCTSENMVPSIIRQGFLKPLTYEEVQCGQTYGRGIYSSPDPTFALMYSGFRRTPTRFNEFAGLKLIACAVVTGICRYMTRDDRWGEYNEPYPGANSHVANDMLEYVVFDNAQIIPCYVIHLDLGRDVAQYVTKLSLNPTAYINQYRHERRQRAYAQAKLSKEPLAPGELKRKKEALFAQAAKYFPYGYGAASGSKFVVEAVGEVSEDEEEYGAYQKDRIDGGEVETDVWAADGHTTLALDSEGVFSDEGGGEGGDSGEEEMIEEEGESEEKVDWEYEMGPEGRTRFDEYYDARKAKVKEWERGRRG